MPGAITVHSQDGASGRNAGGTAATALCPETLASRIQEYFSARQEVQAVYLFGSHARNDASRHSDVDLAIIAERIPERFLDRLLLYPGLHHHLGTPVDLLVYTPTEWHEMRLRPLFRDLRQVWPPPTGGGGAS